MSILSLVKKISVNTQVKTTDSKQSVVDYLVRLEEPTQNDVLINLNSTIVQSANSKLTYSIDKGVTFIDIPSNMQITLPKNGSDVIIRAVSTDTGLYAPDIVNFNITSNDPVVANNVTSTQASIVVSDAGSVIENGRSSLTYKIEVQNATKDVEIVLNTSGTATKGSDYSSTLTYSVDGGATYTTVINGTIIVPAGKSALVKVALKDDAETESDETLFLTASTVDTSIVNKVGTGLGIIKDDRSTLNPNADTEAVASIVLENGKKVVTATELYMQYDLKLSNQIGVNDNVKLFIQKNGTLYPTTIRYSVDEGKTFNIFNQKMPALIDGKNTIIQIVLDAKDAIPSNEFTVLASSENTQISTSIIPIDLTPPAKPFVQIATDTNNDGYINKDENKGELTVHVTLDNKAELKSILVVADNAGNKYTLEVDDNIIKNGVDLKFPQPAEGGVFIVEATVADIVGNVSEKATDSTIININVAPEINNVTLNLAEENLLNGLAKDEKLGITDANNDVLKIKLIAPTTQILINSKIVEWIGTGTKELIGKLDGVDFVKVSVDDLGKYSAQLLAPISHQLNSVKDILSIKIGVEASDGELITKGYLVVDIKDDMPSINESEVISTKAQSIPDIFVGNVSFSGLGGSKISYSFANGAVNVTGNGFANSTDLSLKASNVNQSLNGLGVASTTSPYHNIANEIDFRKSSTGKSASEELIVTLSSGKVSYGAKINFAAMYGGELEVGVAEFYRGNILVSTQTFSSNAKSGNYAANFQVADGGFDKIVIKAADNGNGFNIKDNSDFTVTSVEFLGASAPQPIAFSEGFLNYSYGADGKGSVGLTGNLDKVTTLDGKDIVISSTNNQIIAKDSLGKLVFQLQFTPVTGKWEYFQYQKYLINDGVGEVLDVEFKVTDSDGDEAKSNIKIGVNSMPKTTDDLIIINEDKIYTLKTDDFGTLSSNVTKVKITELPTNGVLQLNGVKVVANQEINLTDILTGKLTFVPNLNTDVDSAFKFKVSDGTFLSNGDNIVTVDVKAIVDGATASINVAKVTKIVTIDNTTFSDTSKGYKVEAYNLDGTLGVISSVKSSNINGFGVKGYASGDSSEIGYKDGKSEQIRVKFDNEVLNINVKFSWLASSESALVKFYKNGLEVGSVSQKGISDTIDGPFTLRPTNCATFDEVRFSSNSSVNDYLINSITYNKAATNSSSENIYNVDLSAALKDVDGSESLSVKISGVPTGATFDSPDIKFVSNDIWEVKVPADAKSVDYKAIKMYVPSDINLVNLKIDATSAEKVQYLEGEDIDLTNVITKSTQIVDINNFKSDILKIDYKDIVDLDNKELVVKGNKGDMVQLDSVADWTQSGKQDKFNVYTYKSDSSIKLLLEDTIELKDI